MQERDNLDDENELQLYAAACNAWFATKLERDKSLLTLSSAGIGILITLASTVGTKSVEMLILYITSLAFFISCASCTLLIFNRNAEYISNTLIHKKDSKDPLLKFFDRAAAVTFGAGLALSCVIGFSTAISSFIERSQEMTQKQKFKDHAGIESFEGAEALRKTKTESTPPAPKDKNTNSKNNSQNPKNNQTD